MVEAGTEIGDNCQISHHAVIGSRPQDLTYRGEPTRLIVGSRTTIREFTTVCRGTVRGGGVTTVGNNTLLMAYVHVAHDCKVGNGVVMANASTLAGHIMIEDYAIIGGLVPIHQFTRVGAYAIVGGLSGVSNDVVPYAMASGSRIKIYGLNMVGLRRRKFSPETIHNLKRAFKILFYSKLNTTQALAQIQSEISGCPEVDHLLEFIKSSKRGICKKVISVSKIDRENAE